MVEIDQAVANKHGRVARKKKRKKRYKDKEIKKAL